MSDNSQPKFDRRTLLQTAAASGVALGLSTLASAAGRKRRFVNVGLGSRSRMYLGALSKTFREGNELVGLCDINPGRLELAAKTVAADGDQPRTFLAADFDRVIAELKP